MMYSGVDGAAGHDVSSDEHEREETMSNEEKTVVLLKPDAHEHDVIGDIISIIEDNGINVEKRYRFPCGSIPREMLEYHYDNLTEYDRKNAVEYMLSGDITALLCSGDNVIGRMRDLGGVTFKPEECKPGTIRKEFSRDTYAASKQEGRSVRNVIHTSDSAQSAERETEIWFGGKFELKYIDETILK